MGFYKKRIILKRKTSHKRRLYVAVGLLAVNSQIRTRNDLKSSSLGDTSYWPWFFENGSDEGFMAEMSLDRGMFNDLLKEFEKHYMIKSGRGRGGRPRKLDKAAALALLLHFYSGKW